MEGEPIKVYLSGNLVPLETVQKKFATINVTKNVVLVVKALSKAEKPLQTHDIKKSTGLSKPTILRILKKLMEQNFIYKFGQRRFSSYLLTEKGYEFYKAYS